MAKKRIPKKVENKVLEFVEILKQDKLPIKKVFVFGSFAKGRSREWSDIDVYVVSNKFNRVDPLVYLWTKRRDIDIERGIEPYGIHPKDFVEENPVAYEVKRTGIPLKK